jgi:hypothetical protein
MRTRALARKGGVTNSAHQGLIDLAREARTAATAGDEDEVEQIAIVMLTELAVHLDDERLAMIKLDAADPELAAGLQARQRRVIERLLELADAPTTSDGACTCIGVADEIVALLDVEIASEEAVAAEHGLPSTSGRSRGRVRRHHPCES